MNKKLLDILVCPFDKVSSLELFQFKAKLDPNNSTTIVDNYSVDGINVLENEKKNDRKVKEDNTISTDPSDSKMNKNPFEIVEEGLLLCRTCLRYYPITEEIPIILPDELRDKKKDLEFLKAWNELIPHDLLKNLKPWTL
jgi:uncharacterized protein YbaR (Trm112 family)